MNGRIYDPLLGRFLSADKLIPKPGNLQSYNRYTYVLNNPLTYIDPDGFREVTLEFWGNVYTADSSGSPAFERKDPVVSLGVGGGVAIRQSLTSRILDVLGGGKGAEYKTWFGDLEQARREGQSQKVISFLEKKVAEAAGERAAESRLDNDAPKEGEADGALDPQNAPSGDDSQSQEEGAPAEPQYPSNPDDWTPPEGVSETPAGEKTGGKHRQWKDDKTGEIVRRWDKEGREGGKERGPHWHDSTRPGEHIPPDDVPPEEPPPPPPPEDTNR